jgi:hypothetical protein
MNPNRKVSTLRFVFPALAVVAFAIATAAHGVPAQPLSGGDSAAAGISDSTPFVISLWPATGRPSLEDRTLAGELEPFLAGRLRPLLADTEYSSIRVEALPDWDAAATRLREGTSHLVECDPVLYFLTIAARERLQSRYRVVLQSVTDPMPRGLILAPRKLGITRPGDLQGRNVAFLHRIAGGAAQIQRALNDLGLAVNRDYSFLNAGYLDNALRNLNLEKGPVDAVAVSSEIVDGHLKPEDLEALATVLETDEILPPLFAGRRADFERYPAFGKGLVEALRAFFGPDRLVPARDDLYERAKEEGLPWE